MRLAWKIAVPVTCAALVGGAVAFLRVPRHQLEQQKLAQEAQASRVHAELGSAEAQYDLARMYFQGQGVPQSYTEAFRWYGKAADQKLAKAQYAVGYSFYHGYGTDGDFAEALRWFHLAADQKHPGAENEIGIAYEVGNGVTPDYGEAVRWYRMSADHGYAAAQYNLGRMYANGRGVMKDRVKAREWITEAAEQGYRPAKQMLGRSWPALSGNQKIRLSLSLAGGTLLLFAGRTLKLDSSSQLRILAGLAGAGILCSVALRLLSSAYASILAPPSVVGAFGFARSFVVGVLLSFLVRMMWRNSPKWTLWVSCFFFVALNGLTLARLNHLQMDSAVWLLLPLNGAPLGLGITSAVLLLRKRRAGETSGPSGPDESAGTGDEDPVHS